MPVKVVDLVEMGHQPDARRVLMDGPKMSTFFHIYPTPGRKDRMHCHNADGTFYVIEGECTMRFPDGPSTVLRPGMAGLITGGTFYQLENTGTGPMIMMGHHSISQAVIKTIDHETRELLNTEKEVREVSRSTRILV